MKKKFLSLQEAFLDIRKKRLFSLDKIKFYQILLFWFFLIFLFGVIYYFFLGRLGADLVSTVSKQPITKATDAVYFSFITATSTGFGDIIPIGFFKVMAIAEVTLGLLLLALVTSKLVSIKQDIILEEIYEMSFKEKINRLRSSLLLFRQHASRIMTHIETDTIDKREINDLYIYIHGMETVLEEMLPLINPEGKNIFTKSIDPVNTELLVNSGLQSFERLLELLNTLSNSKLDWKRPVTISTIRRCILLNSDLYNSLKSSAKKISGFTETKADNERIIAAIENLISG
ncbi:MAG: potassium channel family protein [Nanoarchaeota archaeon]